jgi:hypothetical protein
MPPHFLTWINTSSSSFQLVKEETERERVAGWERDTGPQNDEGGVECRSSAQNVLLIKKCVFDLFWARYLSKNVNREILCKLISLCFYFGVYHWRWNDGLWNYDSDSCSNHSLTHSLTHGAEPFLRSCQLCSHSRTSQHFMEPEGSLPCSQGPFTGLDPEPDQSNPYHPILSL